MSYRHLRYPGGKAKAVTFSYDDGVRHDIRLAEVCNSYGIKCTFNINTVHLPKENGGTNLSANEIKQYILDAGHEVAIHGHQHKAPGLCTPIEIIQDVLTCRMILEDQLGQIIRGMAYPDTGIENACVSPYTTIKQNLVDLGIAYARTLGGDNDRFALPADWHAWMPTVCHSNPDSLRYAESFAQLDLTGKYPAVQWPRLFYIWGHSFEFVNDNNWDLLDQLCQILGCKSDTWYAINIEIYDYVQAYKSLLFSADGRRVFNPTLQKIWFAVDQEVWSAPDQKVYAVEPGQSLVL